MVCKPASFQVRHGSELWQHVTKRAANREDHPLHQAPGYGRAERPGCEERDRNGRGLFAEEHAVVADAPGVGREAHAGWPGRPRENIGMTLKSSRRRFLTSSDMMSTGRG